MEALKNIFDEKFVCELSSYIALYDRTFKQKQFNSKVLNTLEELELKQRMRLISSTIKDFSSLNYKELLEVLKKVKKHFSIEESMSLASMVLPDFVEVYGLNDFDNSIIALEYFTINSSSEFAIRDFIIKYEKETMEYMLLWAKSSNEHIRRLASEGSRPRLPWAKAISSFKKNPELILEILDILKNDKSLYVRRSVANNLNDISKDNPSVLINFVQKNINKNKNLTWLCKHASRTLLKKGNTEILELFSYRKIKDLSINNFELEQNVSIGEYLNFSFNLISSEVLTLIRLEYEIDFIMSNYKRSKKIFMISSSNVKSNNKQISKKHSFKKITTRKYYKGLHYITIIVNGEKIIQKSFNLV